MSTNNLQESASLLKPRLIFIDNIRWVMIILVVMMHVNVTYGNMGSWYYVEKADIGIFSTIVFGIYGSLVQAFFMGFLFLIAGYFIPGGYAKKGPARFIKDRFVRLGIPTLIYMLLISPLNAYILHSFAIEPLPQGHTYLELYVYYILTFEFIGESGPLWFALALLIFSLVYVLYRLARKRNVMQLFNNNNNNNDKLITHKHIIAVVLLIGVVSFLIRSVAPIGSAFLNMQHPFFTQYIVLFTFGIYSYQTNLFQRLPYEFGISWFRYALLGGIPFWVLIMVIGGGLDDRTDLFMGGIHWQSLAYALWESFFCLGVCLGLLVIFREKYNDPHPSTRFLSDQAFGVYVFHAPILILVSSILKGWLIPPLPKAIIVGIISLTLSFSFSWLIRRVSYLRKIFS